MIVGERLTLEEVVRVSRGDAKPQLGEPARKRMAASRGRVEALVREGAVVYGVTTGLGVLKDHPIPPDQAEELQARLVRSHACGVGPPAPRDVVRAMTLLRAHSLARGVSGVRPTVVERLLELVHKDIVPYVPSLGSVGSSGDLAPLAHLALVLMGEGSLLTRDGPQPAPALLKKARVQPLRLAAKEGLSLVNGTQYTTAQSLLALEDARRAWGAALVTGALSLEAYQGSIKPFDPRLLSQRPHPGPLWVGSVVNRLLQGSEVMAAHEHCGRVQDAYSFRCIPQVFGASLEALAYLARTLEIEVNSATDNPLVLDGDVISGGNFHGEPLGPPLVAATAALVKLAAMSERRTARLLEGREAGLPLFLVQEEGLNSGLMIPQYVSAALVNRARSLAWPAIVDTIPTSGEQEDVNSMATTMALQFREVVELVERVIAVELLTAAQAMTFRPWKPASATRAALDLVGAHIPPLQEDRWLHPDLVKASALVRSGAVPATAGARAGVVVPGLSQLARLSHGEPGLPASMAGS